MIHRFLTLPTIIAAAVLTTGGVPPAGILQSAQSRTDALTAALTTILNDDWHPMPTDPCWLEVKRELEVEIARRPRGPIATLARRAAVRIEPHISIPVSQNNSTPSLELPLRPWFNLSVDMPYVIDLHASLDGGPWVLVASGSSGARCSSAVTALR